MLDYSNHIGGFGVADDLADAVKEQVLCSALTGLKCPMNERLNYGKCLTQGWSKTHGCP